MANRDVPAGRRTGRALRTRDVREPSRSRRSRAPPRPRPARTAGTTLQDRRRSTGGGGDRVTHPVTLDILAARGYEVGRRTSALARQLGDVAALPPPDPRFVVERADGELLAIWQEASALGWGHDTPEQRRVSDAFARAAAVVDGEHFVVVRSVTDRRPVATASLTIRDRIATLGGMSTLPAERGRGVQSALIVHRLRTAAAAGCDWATSTAAPGGTSERNLLRHGFEPAGTISTWMR